jgi:hypothetical protein
MFMKGGCLSVPFTDLGNEGMATRRAGSQICLVQLVDATVYRAEVPKGAGLLPVGAGVLS